MSHPRLHHFTAKFVYNFALKTGPYWIAFPGLACWRKAKVILYNHNYTRLSRANIPRLWMTFDTKYHRLIKAAAVDQRHGCTAAQRRGDTTADQHLRRRSDAAISSNRLYTSASRGACENNGASLRVCQRATPSRHYAASAPGGGHTSQTRRGAISRSFTADRQTSSGESWRVEAAAATVNWSCQ